MSWSGEFVVRGPDVGKPWVVPGDHLQLAYLFWLWHDSVASWSHWPWIDPYLFGAGGGGMVTIFGWPLVILSLPVSLVWGPVAAYNVTVYASFMLAATCTALWLRALNITRLGAAVGGLAFAFAPFRIMQSTGHHNALVAWMFPLLLLCLEKALRGPAGKARRWGFISVIALASIILAGESHHSVFAAYITVVYIVIRLPSTSRSRMRLLTAPAAVGAVVTGSLALLIYWYVIRPSDAKGGRAMNEAAHFAPRWMDLFSPGWVHYERYVYIGTVIGLLAAAGLISAIVSRRHRRRAIALAIGFLVCCWFSIAPALVDHPTLQRTYRMVPLFSFSRVPGRLMVVGALLLAALAAIAVDSARAWVRPWMLLPLGALLLIDLPLPLYNGLQSGGNPYSRLRSNASILEFPVRDAGDVAGSIYSLNVMKHPGPRVSGYFVYVPTDREDLAENAKRLQDSPANVCAWRNFQLETDLDYVAVYRQLFPNLDNATAFERSLAAVPGLFSLGTIDGVTTYQVVDPTFGCTDAVS
jgi:hypothetical protein